MSKKERVKLRCKICEKNTTHELRTINNQETYVCLVCEAMPNNPKERHDDYKRVSQVVDAERTRIWGNFPPGIP